jgi:hypothetical protein
VTTQWRERRDNDLASAYDFGDSALNA